MNTFFFNLMLNLQICRFRQSEQGKLTLNHLKRQNRIDPGTILRAHRQKVGLTLSDVAKKTGLPVSTLSRLEGGKIAMTYEKLLQISEGLHIDIGVLIAPGRGETERAESGHRRSITRAGEGQRVATPTGDYLYVAADLLDKIITPIIGDVTARDVKEYDAFLHHSGEEYLFVLSGTLDLFTEVYAPMRLAKGDSVYFDSSMGHAYVAVGDRPCQVLSICATRSGESSGQHSLGPHPREITSAGSGTFLADKDESRGRVRVGQLKARSAGRRRKTQR